MVAKMSYPPKVGAYCNVCGKLVREEYFTGNVDVLVCDKCKDAIAWAKEKMKKYEEI